MHPCACMQGAIHQSIEWLDKLGMNAIEQVRHALRRGSCCIAPLQKYTEAPHLQGSPEAFANYLRQYGNTICGRHPIGVFLNVCPASLFRDSCSVRGNVSELTGGCVMQMLRACRTQHSIRFKHYDQSSQCVTARDSSVSYAAAVVTIASPSSAAPAR